MRLIYRCANCGMTNEVPVPVQGEACLIVKAALMGVEVNGHGLRVNPVVIHPCDASTAGVANLIAVTDA